jgi:ABC-2 type transport system permease protein
MDPRLHAIRSGMRRGWTEFMLSIRSPQDQGFYLFMALITLIYLFFNRVDRVEGTDLYFPAVPCPASWARWSRSTW